MTSPEESLQSKADRCHVCSGPTPPPASPVGPVDTPGVVPVWKAKCFLIKRQSKNKPLFGSLSCVYGAANPHLLPEVKTVWGSRVGSACTEVKEVGEAKFSGPISSKHSITNAPFLPPCMFPCFHCVLFGHVCNCASGRNAWCSCGCLNCLNAWVRLLQRLFQHKYLENRLELYSRLPRISLVRPSKCSLCALETVQRGSQVGVLRWWWWGRLLGR